MADIEKITKLTDNPFLNLYQLDGKNSKGFEARYYAASRAKKERDLKLCSGRNDPDGVLIYSLYGPAHDQVVLIRQFRYPIGDFVYEFPAGLVEKDEDIYQAAAREMHEETGLDLEILPCDPLFEAPRFTTVGLTDESDAIVYGYASGTVSSLYQEKSEEIEVVIADREKVRKIMRTQRVSAMCAYQLMHFISDPEPFGFLKESHDA